MKIQVDTDDGLLKVDVDSTILATIEEALGDLKSESRKVLKNAVNATAKKAKADLIDKAQAEYTAKKSGLKKATTTKNATVSAPTATITVKGETLELKEFKTTAPKSGVKAKVAARSTLKLVQSSKGDKAKAFIATFESGHTAIVQRQYGQIYKRDLEKRRRKYGPHADVTRLKKLLSISFPKMVGGSSVIGELGTSILDTLQENIQKEIEKVLKK